VRLKDCFYEDFPDLETVINLLVSNFFKSFVLKNEYICVLKRETLMSIIVEVAVESVDGALIAQQNGANRLELCSALELGGLTPSAGLMCAVKKNSSIPVFALIRPRSGDFLYSETEFETILNDVLEAKKQELDGVVIGFLNSDGTIDLNRTKKVCELAFPMKVTFHRAFDVCNNPYKALEDIIEAGCHRILTSGQAQTAFDGIITIQTLVEKAQNRIVILAGSGVRANNVMEIIEKGSVKEVHTSAKIQIDSKMTYRKQGVNMGSKAYNEFAIVTVDGKMVHKIRTIIGAK